MHGLLRSTSAREIQVCNDIITFDAPLRKSLYNFLIRCKISKSSIIKYTVYSDYFFNCDYFKYVNDSLNYSDTFDWFDCLGAAGLIWFEVTLFVCLLYKFHAPGNMPIKISRVARLN